MDSPFIIVITTCPNTETAKSVTESLISQNLAACVQSDNITSTYRWQGKIETDREVRLMIKTRRVHFEAISSVLNQAIGYETPEIIAVPILQGSRGYLDWIELET